MYANYSVHTNFPHPQINNRFDWRQISDSDDEEPLQNRSHDGLITKILILKEELKQARQDLAQERSLRATFKGQYLG